jgi:hypothetical protein
VSDGPFAKTHPLLKARRPRRLMECARWAAAQEFFAGVEAGENVTFTDLLKSINQRFD